MKKSKYAEVFRFLGMGLAVLLLTGLLVKACNYLLVDDTESYTRLTLHDLYQEEENIDTLFLGSSHCFRAYDPMLYEELTGRNAFNLGSSAQNYDTSYYLLREAARRNHLETVYLDMHYKFLFIGKEDKDLVQANIISDYMRPSLNKLEFLLCTSESRHYTNRLLPFRREWKKMEDPSYLKEVWDKKRQESYRNYEPVVREQEYYAGKGFVSSREVLDAEAITWWENFGLIRDDMESSETYTLSYLEKIVEFCEKEKIRLIFVTAPSFDRYLEAVGPYDQAYAYIRELAEKYGISYLDFNLCREEYLDFTEEDFLDVDHLNGRGARTLTEFLAEIEEELISHRLQIDEYFKPWYDEK